MNRSKETGSSDTFVSKAWSLFNLGCFVVFFAVSDFLRLGVWGLKILSKAILSDPVLLISARALNVRLSNT